MCIHYEALKNPKRYQQAFNVAPPSSLGKGDMWPKYTGVFIRRPPETDPHDEAVPEREAVNGRWGLVPWATKPDKADQQMKLSTVNARSEGVQESFTFRGAWQRAQHCIVPVEAFFEPDWRSGKAIPTRFTRSDGAPMGIAGLWDRWQQSDGQWLLSYTMMTIDAATHPLLRGYHRPNDKKRMIVILPEDAYATWLDAPPERSMDFMRQYPADRLVATPQAKAT